MWVCSGKKSDSKSRASASRPRSATSIAYSAGNIVTPKSMAHPSVRGDASSTSPRHGCALARAPGRPVGAVLRRLTPDRDADDRVDDAVVDRFLGAHPEVAREIP